MTRLVGMGSAEIREAAKLVLKGGLIAYPTDTVYGLGCDPFDPQAVDRLVEAKRRVKSALPILVNSLDHAKRIGEFDAESTQLAKRFWPGPVTLIVPALEGLPLKVTGDSQQVGLRIPNHEKTLNLIEKCGGALVGTSANISGGASLTTAAAVMSELNGRIDLVLDGGPSLLSIESTVVRAFGGEISILRQGAISRDDILKAARVARAR